MADRMDPETRQRVTSAGGHARAEALSPERRSEIGRSAAAAINSPAALARRIVKAWPSLSRADRAEVRRILAPVVVPQASPRGRSTKATKAGAAGLAIAVSVGLGAAVPAEADWTERSASEMRALLWSSPEELIHHGAHGHLPHVAELDVYESSMDNFSPAATGMPESDMALASPILVPRAPRRDREPSQPWAHHGTGSQRGQYRRV